MQSENSESSGNISVQYGPSETPYPEPFTKIPDAVKEKKIGQLSEDQIRRFYEDGFVIVTDYFSPTELLPCRKAVGELVEDFAQKLYAAGKIKSLYREYGIFQRLTKLEEVLPGATIMLFKEGTLPKAFMDLWSSDKLLNMAEQILGPEIAGHPVWNLRVKTPYNDSSNVPWHQDSAYFSADSYDHMVLTAWVPFLDTNENNGGMQMARGSHKKGVVARHTCCHDGFWYVMLDEEDIQSHLDCNVKENLVACDVPYGGFLLFNNLTAHRSLPNVSNDVRWSVDLRWQDPRHPWGFYDIAPGILMKSSDEPDLKPDWEKFLKVNRKQVWQSRHYGEVKAAEPFDTTVTGPWIGRWPIVNHNKHTDSFNETAKQTAK